MENRSKLKVPCLLLGLGGILASLFLPLLKTEPLASVPQSVLDEYPANAEGSLLDFIRAVLANEDSLSVLIVILLPFFLALAALIVLAATNNPLAGATFCGVAAGCMYLLPDLVRRSVSFDLLTGVLDTLSDGPFLPAITLRLGIGATVFLLCFAVGGLCALFPLLQRGQQPAAVPFPAAPAPHRRCGVCGAENAPAYRFCRSCGSAL